MPSHRYLRSGTTWLTAPGPGNPHGVRAGFLAGLRLRLRLYQVKTPKDEEDVVLLDETIQGEQISPNEPILFNVSHVPTRYMASIMAELSLLSLTSTNQGIKNDGMLTVRFRKGR